jgi:hypothetical protein
MEWLVSRPRWVVVVLQVWIAVFLCHAADEPVTIKAGTDDGGNIALIIHNNSQAAITAVSFRLDSQMPTIYDSLLKGWDRIAPNQEAKIVLVRSKELPHVALAATIFDDGNVFGDPSEVRALLNARRLALAMIARILERIPPTAANAGELMDNLTAWIQSEFNGDLELKAAALRVGLIVRRRLSSRQTTDDPAGYVIGLLRSWQDELRASKPSVAGGL